MRLVYGSIYIASASLLLASVGGVNAARAEDGKYSADIRRTEYGIPHIKADRWDGLGFGIGYALAEENVCDMLEIQITARGERSLYFGPSGGNLESDFYRKAHIDTGVTETLLDNEKTRPSADYLDLVKGYVAGFNQYLKEKGAGLPDPRCARKPWVKPTSEIDYLRMRTIGRRGTLEFTADISRATPPGKASIFETPVKKSDLNLEHDPEMMEASNGWAIGPEHTVNGTGLLVGSPHTTWEVTTPPAFSPGRYQLYHATIPGTYNAIGITRMGSIAHHFAMNEKVARTHTVSTAERHSVYRLKLDPSDPTTYIYDGQPRKMTSREVTVQVKDDGGRIQPRTTTIYYSHYGPVFSNEEMPWTRETAYTVRAANTPMENIRVEEHKLALGQATSVRDMLEILKRYQVQDNNTIAVDAKETLLADVGNIPHITNEKLQRCGTVDILDGSRSECEWGADADAVRPGIYSPSKGVVRIGAPYVANSNNGPWMSVPDEPVVGLARVFGEEKAELTPRARMGLTMVQDRIAGVDGLPGKKFDLANAQEIFLRSRSKIGELVVDDLVALCRANTGSHVLSVDLKPACEALSGWNRTFDIDARGAHLFREFRQAGGIVYRIPFNPADPVNTPRQLATDDPKVLEALVVAVKKLNEKQIPLDARLGDVQFTLFNDERIAQRGSVNADGLFNPIGIKPHEKGYAAAGSTSLVYFAEYSKDRVESRGMIVYSLSGNPRSLHASDMTRAYASGRIVNWRFNEEDIEADPHLVRYRVTN